MRKKQHKHFSLSTTTIRKIKELIELEPRYKDNNSLMIEILINERHSLIQDTQSLIKENIRINEIKMSSLREENKAYKLFLDKERSSPNNPLKKER